MKVKAAAFYMACRFSSMLAFRYDLWSYCKFMHTKVVLLLVLAFNLLTACQKDLPVSAYDYKTLGAAAHDLLSSSTYTSLQVECNYMPGFAPDYHSLADLKTFLQRYLNKPDGIIIIVNEIVADGKAQLTLNDIINVEKRNRTSFTAGNTMAVHILITDAYYSDVDNLAISYWNTSICLFGKAIYANSSQIGKTKLMTVLLEHEFGHLLGLVGQGTLELTPHKDAANGFHCNNPGCLMYFAIETDPAINTLPSFDANCIADLKANGSK